MKITIHERNLDASNFGLPPAKAEIFNRLRSEKVNNTGIPRLDDIFGLEVATLDPKTVFWIRDPWYLCVGNKEYKNPKWAVDRYNQITNVVNDHRLSGVVDDAIENYIASEFPDAKLVDVVDTSEYKWFLRPRRYIYDMGDSKLFMVLDVSLIHGNDVNGKDGDTKFFVMPTIPAVTCTLYKGEYPQRGKYSLDKKYYEKENFNFNKDMPKLESYINDVYQEFPKTYKYMIGSPLYRARDLENYGDTLERKLLQWAKENGVVINNVTQRTDHDDRYVDMFYIDTYNTHHDAIAKFLEYEKKNAPGWVGYGISGLH